MTATIIAFPQRRNLGKARDVAAKLLRHRPGPHRAAYVRLINQAFISVMGRLGFSDQQILVELQGFWRLVDQVISNQMDARQSLPREDQQ